MAAIRARIGAEGSTRPFTPEGQAPLPDSSGTVRIDGTEQRKKLIKQVMPKYPPYLTEVSIEGDVHMEAVIDKSGKIISLKITSGVNSFGNRL